MSQYTEINLADLTYHILPAKRFAGSSFAKVHDDVFNFFVARWTEAFNAIKDQGTPAHGWEDHFLKQDVVTAISYKGKIIAAHLYTIYDLAAASTQKSEYFSFFSPQTKNHWQQNNIQTVATMEYLCVDSAIKRNSLELSMGKIILGLGAYMAETLGLDGCVGTPLAGNKVDLMMKNVGGYLVEKDVSKYGFPVDLWFIPTLPCEGNKDPQYELAMQTLWERRQDYTKEFFNKLAA